MATATRVSDIGPQQPFPPKTKIDKFLSTVAKKLGYPELFSGFKISGDFEIHWGNFEKYFREHPEFLRICVKKPDIWHFLG